MRFPCPLLLAVVCATLARCETPMASGLLSMESAIPLSIRNEVDVAIENGRVYLEGRQGPDGFWALAEGAERSSLPAFAFLEPPVFGMEPSEPLRKALSGALKRLSERAPYVQSREALRAMAEDALVVAAALSVFGEQVLPEGTDPAVLASVRTRLAGIDLRGEAPATAWLCRTVLDLLPGQSDDPSVWESLYRNIAVQGNPAVRDVAIAGYARLRRDHGADGPPALRAHLRWLRTHADVFTGASGNQTPEDLYYLAAFLNATPPVLALESGIPADWRTDIAQDLIASAKAKDGGSRWTDTDPIRQTLFAVATLITL